MKKSVFLCLLLTIFFVGCTASDEYESNSAKMEYASEVLYKLADDYGISITLGPGFSTLPAEKLNMSKVKEEFRKLASLKGTYYMIPKDSKGKDGAVTYTCIKRKPRSRSMYSDEFGRDIYQYNSEDLGDGLFGYCQAKFTDLNYHSTKCEVSAWITDTKRTSRSECSIDTKMKNFTEATFSGVVRSITEYRDFFAETGCTDKHCEESGKCTCSDLCWPVCYGYNCDYCKFENGMKFYTVTITYEVRGECSRNSGQIQWRYIGEDE